jgi:hypothetical protein
MKTVFVWLIVGGLYTAATFLIAYWTDRNLDFVVSLLRHTSTDVPFWLSFVSTLLFSPLVLPFNILMEIIRVFL